MAVNVRIPSFLQTLTQGREEVSMSEGTVIGIVSILDEAYPGITEKITDGGKIKGFINIYVNEEDIRFLNGEETWVKDGDEVSIIPAIAGGADNLFEGK
jgi:molybdopterin synthase sulfur carrier subunit